MLDATVEWMGHGVYTPMHTEPAPADGPQSHTAIAPCDDVYPTRDGQMLIGVQNDSGWRTLITRSSGVHRPGRGSTLRHQRAARTNRSESDEVIAAQTSR